MVLFRGIEFPSDEPVLYVGVHPLRWTERDEPTMGFVPIEDSEYAVLSAERDALQARIDRVVMMIGRTLGSTTSWEEMATLYGIALADARDILGGKSNGND